jgi:P-type E1-E2 ATPase
VLEARGCAAQEAILTGESVTVERGQTPVAADAGQGDPRLMQLSGTLVTQGTARGLVVATLAATEIGWIRGLLAVVEQLTTTLVAQVDLFLRVVGVAMAATPEDLPAVMTITRANGLQAMARRNAIFRRLPAIGAIGSVSVI